MRRSQDRLITTHVGSLSRPIDLLSLNRARAEAAVDDAAYSTALAGAVADVVRKQGEVGIDIPNDGEFGKRPTIMERGGTTPLSGSTASLLPIRFPNPNIRNQLWPSCRSRASPVGVTGGNSASSIRTRPVGSSEARRRAAPGVPYASAPSAIRARPGRKPISPTSKRPWPPAAQGKVS